jgi:hypothetical protein
VDDLVVLGYDWQGKLLAVDGAVLPDIAGPGVGCTESVFGNVAGGSGTLLCVPCFSGMFHGSVSPVVVVQHT